MMRTRHQRPRWQVALWETVRTGRALGQDRNIAEFGQALAEGIKRGEVFTGGEDFFSAEHFAPSGAWTRYREMFPLPVDFEGSLAQASHTAVPGAKAWTELCSFALNRLAGQKGAMPKMRTAERVKKVKENLEERVGRFLKSEVEVEVCSRTLWQDLKSKQVNYEGEEIGNPEPLTCLQIEKGLPPKGHGASVPLSPLLEGKTRHLVLNPEECLLEKKDRSPGKATARVHIAEGEGLKVWRLLEERGIVDWIRLSEVFHDEEGPYLSGMFGVPKAGRYCANGAVVLRVIMNLQPVNRILTVIKGDISELPNAAVWTQLVVDGEDIIQISQADMAAAFYLFGMPSQWKKLFGFNSKYTSAQLGKEGNDTWVPCCKVLPMGWASSVGLMQMASRQMIRQLGSNHGEEIRRCKQTAKWFTDSLRKEGDRKWWQVYLDNYMCGSIETPSSSTGTATRMHGEAVASWAAQGVVSAADKHVISADSATELGVRIDGDSGLVGAAPERFLKLIAVTVILVGHRLPPVKWVQIVLGRWIFALQFRRPAMAVLSQSWQYIKAGQDRRRWWPAVRRELCLLLCLVPLLQSDMKQEFSSTVTCSDASEYGGAVAISEVLTSSGCSLLGRLSSTLAEPQEAMLLVISVFNGIGGGFRGYDLSGVQPHALISIEIDKAARRVCRKAWPRAIEIADVREITRETVKQWANMFPRVTHVQLLAGFPCVHLSSVRANRRNLEGEGSALFWDLKKLIDMVEEEFGTFAEVDFMVENVLSMDADARTEISSVLGVEPIAVCPSDVLPYGRPRIAWVSRPMYCTEGVTMEQCRGYMWECGWKLNRSQTAAGLSQGGKGAILGDVSRHSWRQSRGRVLQKSLQASADAPVRRLSDGRATITNFHLTNTRCGISSETNMVTCGTPTAGKGKDC